MGILSMYEVKKATELKVPSETQLKYLAELWDSYSTINSINIDFPIPSSMEQASIKIKEFQKLVPPVEKTRDKLVDIYRFGLASEDEVDSCLTEMSARDLYEKYKEVLVKMQAGMCSLKRALFIQKLQSELNVEQLSLIDSAKLTAIGAANLIEELLLESRKKTESRFAKKVQVSNYADYTDRSKDYDESKSDIAIQERSEDERLYIFLASMLGNPVAALTDFATINTSSENQKLINQVTLVFGDEKASEMFAEFETSCSTIATVA